MRSHRQGAAAGDEVVGVIALVTAERPALPVGVARRGVGAASAPLPLRMTVGLGELDIHDQPFRFSISAWPV